MVEDNLFPSLIRAFGTPVDLRHSPDDRFRYTLGIMLAGLRATAAS